MLRINVTNYSFVVLRISTLWINKKGPPKLVSLFHLYMARPARFERATAWFVARYSIQLSYGRLKEVRTIHGLMPDFQ